MVMKSDVYSPCVKNDIEAITIDHTDSQNTSVSSLFRTFTRPNLTCQVRHKKIYRKITQADIDEDFSWAAPIIEKQLAQREGKEEPEKEVSKLHMVYRVKPMEGRPYWEKDICIKYGLDQKQNQKVVLKNIPSVNKDLNYIKHLIKIIPITFPHGLPESEEDYEHCVLQDNGEFVVKKRLEPVIEDGDVKVDKEPKTDIWQMDLDELKRHSRKKLDNWDLNSEFFEPEYVYEYNQDGKEYRYFGDKSMGGKRKKWY